MDNPQGTPGRKMDVQSFLEVFKKSDQSTETPTETAITKKQKKKKTKKTSVAQRLQMQAQPQVTSTPVQPTQPTSVQSSQTRKVRTVSQSGKQKVTPQHPQQSNPQQPSVICKTIEFDEALKDLNFRFIQNMPEQDKTNMVRVCFQLELAFWFYLDYYTEDEDTGHLYKKMGFRDFVIYFLKHCKDLKKFSNDIDATIAEWMDYKKRVPTYGGILLDQSLDNVLLVQSYGSKTWTFPKGKANQNEDPRVCAIREVREETSFDFSTVSKKEKRVQKMLGDKMSCLFIVKNVPRDFKFAPMTKKEIRDIQWFNVWDLPGKGEQGIHHKFFIVQHFLQDLHNYIRKEKARSEVPPKGLSFSGNDIIQSLMGDQPCSSKSTEKATKIPEEETVERPPLLNQLLTMDPLTKEATFPIGYTPLKSFPTAPDVGYLSKAVEFKAGKVYSGGLPKDWPVTSTTEGTLVEILRSANSDSSQDPNRPIPGGMFSLAPQAVPTAKLDEALQPDAAEWYQQGTVPQYTYQPLSTTTQPSIPPMHTQTIVHQPTSTVPSVIRHSKISTSERSAFTPITKQNSLESIRSRFGSNTSLVPVAVARRTYSPRVVALPLSKPSSVASSIRTLTTGMTPDRQSVAPISIMTPRDVLRSGCEAWNRPFKLDYDYILEPFRR